MRRVRRRRYIAKRQAARAGAGSVAMSPIISGGGSGASGGASVSVRGPFPFAFNTAGIDVDGAVLHALSAGSVVTQALIVVTQIWSGAGLAADRFLTVGIGPASSPASWLQAGQTLTGRIATSPSSSSGLIQDAEELQNTFPALCGEDAVAVIFSEPAGMTQGAGVLYLCVTDAVVA